MDPEPSDRIDGASAQPPLSDTEKNVLKKQLNLSPEQEEELSALSLDLQDAWYEVARSWYAPAARLAAIDMEVGDGESRVAAIHVPSAEGVATYRGLFGGNGSLLSEEEKAHVCRLLQRQIGFVGNGGNKGHTNGNGKTPEGEPSD